MTFNNYRVTNPKNGIVNYQSYVGELFHDYATELLELVFSNASVDQPRFFDEQLIIKASQMRPGLRPSDGIVVDGTAIVPLDMGVTGLAVEAMVGANSGSHAVDAVSITAL